MITPLELGWLYCDTKCALVYLGLLGSVLFIAACFVGAIVLAIVWWFTKPKNPQ